MGNHVTSIVFGQLIVKSLVVCFSTRQNKVLEMASQRVDYWDGRWKANQSPWHKNETNNFLVNHFSHITKIKTPARILVPLCGKAVDMKWMYDSGHSVVVSKAWKNQSSSFLLNKILNTVKKWSEIAHAIQQKMED